MSRKRVHIWSHPDFKKLIDESGMPATRFTKRLAEKLQEEKEHIVRVRVKPRGLNFKL